MFIFDSVLSEINIYEINFLNAVVRGMNVCKKCQGADCLSFLLTSQTIFYALTHIVNKYFVRPYVHSVQQKSSGLKFSKSRNGSHMTYSCHYNSTRFTFPIFLHSWRFSSFHSLQSITPRLY